MGPCAARAAGGCTHGAGPGPARPRSSGARVELLRRAAPTPCHPQATPGPAAPPPTAPPQPARPGHRPPRPTSGGSGGLLPFPGAGPRAERRDGAAAASTGGRGARVMAELAQGQSAAPVGIKPEGFVDALHRVRQVSAGQGRAGGGRRPRGAARPRGRPEGPGRRPADRSSQRCSGAALGGPARGWGLGACGGGRGPGSCLERAVCK